MVDFPFRLLMWKLFLLQNLLGGSIVRNSLLIKISIVLTIIVGLIVSNGLETKAATTYSGIVKVSSTSLKEKASSKAKTVGTLKKGSIINVYAKSKSGWAEVYYKKKKAYISTKHLTLSKKISFLMDKTKVYTYENANGATVSLKYSHQKDGWNVWKTRLGTSGDVIERETKYALEGKDGSQVFEQLNYPLYVGKKVTYRNEVTKISSLTKTVKTIAGTYKNCIELQQLESGDTSYFARGVGLVLVKHGKSIELQLAQKKSEKDIKADEKTIKSMVTRNTKNLEIENTNEYLKDISKANHTKTKEALEVIFSNTDLEYEILSLKFLSMTNKEVIIEVKTRVISTYVAPRYTFQNNTHTSIHSIIKENGKYVISESGVTDIEYIN